VAAENKLIYNV